MAEMPAVGRIVFGASSPLPADCSPDQARAFRSGVAFARNIVDAAAPDCPVWYKVQILRELDGALFRLSSDDVLRP